MATRQNANPTRIGTNVVVHSWSGLLNGDDGSPIELLDFADYSVEVAGTFGVGGTIVLEGSNAGAAYATLTDAQGSPISKTAAGLEQVVETCRYVRPRVTAGDGTTNLAVTLYARRGRS